MALNWNVPFTLTLAASGLTVTDATGASCTVIVAVSLLPSLVAVIVAPPAAFAVTSPLELTVATVVLLLAQVTVRPVSTFPTESFRVAVSCAVPPTGEVTVAGVTVTVATGAGVGGAVTVTVDEPTLPSLVAVMVAEPAALPVTSPLVLTVATVVLLVAHVTVRPVS